MANDMTQTFTTAQGRAYVFIAVDHCSGEFVGILKAQLIGRSLWNRLNRLTA